MHETVQIEPAISTEHIGRIYKMISEIPFFSDSRISEIEILPGGLTNSNYKVTIGGVTYAVRIAGAGTMEYLNRPAEKHNAQLMADIGISAPIIHYDETTGNQVCKYIDDCKTLHIPDFKEEERYLSMAAKVFRKYHDCQKEFISVFDPLKEIDAYMALLAEKNFEFYEGAETMEAKIGEIKTLFKNNPPPKAPCHNDPLCENWLDDQKNFYLIDWEYGGMNDPLFDLGALALEAELTDEQEQFFLKEYFGGELTEKQIGSLVINKFLCDALWAYWAVLQIAMGKSREDYWPYGLNRFNRAYELIHKGSLDRAIKANQ
ncbi:putative choline kinase involved in LPS biosynthesis [Desulfosporosinus orientis DSM 765]|uniref:Putative choline kinase involved in LPS biosynthesis n=1 Tax=Desulfosporosinus orientis (strain ATCC 19365 / DSM 765 / NCIMB 8382 / VKM B-1628 / Singapore I) TaxID=768706 RepID=G7WET8_DESOD|nr:choline kinase family protein [Desulfosporosinus orientis]AET67267.1 putative choline kinase involved in LPS biosynthesis [Desulfosporosinus orientis DSM 765]